MRRSWRTLATLPVVMLLFAMNIAFMGGTSITAASGLPRIESDDLAWEMLSRLNAERSRNGLAELSASDEVQLVATERALDMATHDYFAHTSPQGIGPAELLHQHGVAFHAMGENIAMSSHPAGGVIGVVHDMLVASPGHRANMLGGQYGRVGIGVASNGDTFYFAVVFLD